MKTFFKVFCLILFVQMFGSLALADASCSCSGTMVPNPLPNVCGTCVATTGCTWNGATTCQTDNPANSVLINPLGGTADKPAGVTSVPILIGIIIDGVLGIVGSLALIMFIIGGFTWMLAAGNEQAIEKGKNILIWATIGLVVIFASYSIIGFIIKTVVPVA